MRKTMYISKYWIYMLLPFLFWGGKTPDSNPIKPNIIVFLADDLGYGETGVYGQQWIRTPNIDQLASEGMLFTQHYSGAPVCAPARCVLLTGMHSGHAYIRGNDEWAARGEVWNYKAAIDNPVLEGQRPIPDSILTVAEILKEEGYITGVFGKWGLGAPNTEGIPNKQGFDEFYGYNCQRQAHNLYPPFLWHNEEKVLLENKIVVPGTKLSPDDDPNDISSYAKFTQKDYGPEMIHKKALEFIDQHSREPFFMFYASPLPHVPLQLPQREVDEYKEKIGMEEAYLGQKGYFPNKYPRATYAGMITYLDQQLGEIMKELEKKGIKENTIILFTSDNGPTYAGGADYDFFESSKPFKNGYGRTKGFLYEGGIRVPLIVSWPGKIKTESYSSHISSFQDILPTLCEIGGAEIPENIDGISFKSELKRQEQEKHNHLYWEFPSYKGQQAIRMGKWKGIRKNIFDGNMEIELYNLEEDILESKNIAGQNPEIIKKMEKIMSEEHEEAELSRFKIKELGDTE